MRVGGKRGSMELPESSGGYVGVSAEVETPY